MIPRGLSLGFFSLCLLLFATFAWGNSEQRLCAIEIHSPFNIDFSKTEERLLCGDPEVQAWKEIPLAEKRFFLRSFLQARGFHFPRFEFRDNLLFVDTGNLTETKEFTVGVEGASVDPHERRRVRGHTLTPDLVKEQELWVKRQLQYQGYPCPVLRARGITDLGRIEVTGRPGPWRVFEPIESETNLVVDPDVLERFRAFRNQQPFDFRLLELSSMRIQNEGLYVAAYYDIICENDTSRIVRRFSPAKPKLLTIGVGYDTELGPLVRAKFRRVAIGRRADSWTNELLLSHRIQRVSTSYHWHFLKDLSSRLELVPLISVERLNEPLYLTTTYTTGGRLHTSWEFPTFQLAAESGPELVHTVTQEGVGARRLTRARLGSQIEAISHLFEYFASQPHTGWDIRAEVYNQKAGFLAEQSVQQFVVDHHLLWNIGNYDPPLLILGWRGRMGTFVVNPGQDINAGIPVSDRFFLGGDSDIRGFSRKELPRNGQGFLTILYEGVELRAGQWFSVPIQPLIFVDYAKAGERSGSFDKPSYYSPGTGVRYSSPIGSLRATVAKGIISSRGSVGITPGVQFFFSLGREF